MAMAKNTIQPKKEIKLSTFLTSPLVKSKISATIGVKNIDTFTASLVSAVAINPKLAECDNASLLATAFLGESLKLVPSPQLGQYYMVPFKNKNEGTTKATFILGYKGYVTLAIRSGFYKKINVLEIKEGELISYNPLEEEISVNLIDDEELRASTKTSGFYVTFEYLNGFKKSIYWSMNKMLTHADQYSSAFSKASYIKLQNGEIEQKDLWKYSSFWYKDFDEMAKKTMLRQILSKWGLLSVEMTSALQIETTQETEIGEIIDGTAEEVTAPVEKVVAPAEKVIAPAEEDVAMIF